MSNSLLHDETLALAINYFQFLWYLPSGNYWKADTY